MAPASVAIVGASPTSRYGRNLVSNFTTLGFPGRVAAVNPRYPEIEGIPCFPTLSDIPFVPDAVILSLSWDKVVPVFEEAARLGVRGAVLFAIGLGEVGGEGKRLQDRLAAVAREAGMAVIGPNCQGFINFHHPAPMYSGLVQPYKAGSVAFISHSGSVTQAIANNTRGVRFSHVASSGNEAVTGCEDVLGWYLDDPNTKLIIAFLETIRKPEQFFTECDRAYELGKPVVVLKSGRTAAATEAATAHSGALALPDRLIDELFRRHKVVRVNSTEELLETAKALAGPLPKGPGIACTTGSGGQVELLLDAAADSGATFPEFRPETAGKLRGILADFLGTRNPLDVWGTPDLDRRYPEVLKAIAADPNVHAIFPVVGTEYHPAGSPDSQGRWSYARADHVALVTELRRHTDKAVGLLSCVDGSVPPEVVDELATQDVVVLSGLHEGLRALKLAADYAAPRAAPALTEPLPARWERLGEGAFSGQAALDLIAAGGIPTVRSIVVQGPNEAIAAAEKLGFPVVLKLGDPSALHKTEAAGVITGLETVEAVRAAALRLGRPLLIQQQVSGGLEMILGLQTDPRLGTFVLCGLGGIWAEALDDVAIRPVPLLEDEAQAMVDQLRCRSWLNGLRGSRPLDVTALIQAIERLAALGASLGSKVSSLDINPLFVLPDGVVAVDALIVPS
jgi:acyl-CoA synthetase (NDP forming)